MKTQQPEWVPRARVNRLPSQSSAVIMSPQITPDCFYQRPTPDPLVTHFALLLKHLLLMFSSHHLAATTDSDPAKFPSACMSSFRPLPDNTSSRGFAPPNHEDQLSGFVLSFSSFYGSHECYYCFIPPIFLVHPPSPLLYRFLVTSYTSSVYPRLADDLVFTGLQF